MSDFDFNKAIIKAAEAIKGNTICPEHNTSPNYEIDRTGDKYSVKWSCCCDAIKEEVEKKFADETTKQVGDAMAKSIADIFKKK